MSVKASLYKKSIYSIGLTREEEAIIWDFYVTKSVAASASQKRNVSEYGLKQLPYKEMIASAGIKEERVKILLANSINETLKNFGLDFGKIGTPTEEEIDIDELRIVCQTPFSISDEESPKAKYSPAESLLTHIRNAFAHGNTYFFENQNVLLEDKDNRGAITARILLNVKTLLDWISLIDHEERFYCLHKS